MQADADKKLVKKQALDYAISYFKEKSNELITLYTLESMKLLKQYSIIRNEWLDHAHKLE